MLCGRKTKILSGVQSGGGKVNELLCNEPPCNVLNGAITQEQVCVAMQCMNAAESDTILRNTHVYHPRLVA